MTPKTRAVRIGLAGIAGGTVVGLLGMLLAWAPIGEPLVRWSYDLPFHFVNHDPGTNVAIVYMDEESHAKLGQLFNRPWDRRRHAELVRRLAKDGASLIFFDVVFSDPEPDQDAEFAEAIRQHPRVILGASLDRGNFLSVLDPALTNVAAGVGLINFQPDDAWQGVRRLWTGSAEYPSATWLAAVSMGLTNENRMQDRWINYYVRHDLEPGQLPSFSYHKVIDNTVPPGTFRNKAVFIGSRLDVGYAGAAPDHFSTVFSGLSGRSAPGVDVHATSFLNLWCHHWLSRLPAPLELGLLMLAGLGFGWGFSMLKPLSAVAGAVGAVLAVCLLTGMLVAQRWWFAWLVVAGVQVPLALAWSITYNAVRAEIDKRLLMASLSVYLSPARVKQVLRQPDLLKPGATRQTVSILFSDIAGFSKVAEMKRPEDLVRLLNKYYDAAIACIYQTDGTVMDLIGDAIFAMWNAPQEQPDHQERALRAALLLQDRLKAFRDTEHDLPLHTRVGLHTGTVCVGNIGSATRFDYAAIGDDVNMASRLEALNKPLGTLTLATRDIQAGFEDRYVWRLVGHFKFKGKFRPVEVYELVGPPETEGETKPWRETFAEGLHQFQCRNFARAEEQFILTLKRRPNDGPARYYLNRSEDFRAKSPPDDWSGEIDLEGK